MNFFDQAKSRFTAAGIVSCCFTVMIALAGLTAGAIAADLESLSSTGPPDGRTETAAESAYSEPVPGVDTVTFDFDAGMEGWGFLNPPDQVQEYVPYLSNDTCKTYYGMISTSPPFDLTADQFDGNSVLEWYCPFQGYWNDTCDYRWWVKSIIAPTTQEWNGCERIEARVYKATGVDRVYAMIGFRKAGDDNFTYVGWTGALPTNNWKTVYLNEPTAGAFDDLAAVSIILGAWDADGNVYVDWVRGINQLAPDPPTLVSPANGSETQNNLVTFNWSGEGSYFTLQYATQSSFSNATTVPNIYSSQYSPAAALPNSSGAHDTAWFWRVGAYNSEGEFSGYSAVSRFRITGPHEVPSEFPTIGAAAGAFFSFGGGTVLVAPGTYSGAGNHNIIIGGERHIDIISSAGPQSTIIDLQGEYPAFDFDWYSLGGSVEGFTIRNGYAGSQEGVIRAWSVSPTIRNCIIEGSTGSAIHLRGDCMATVVDCIIRQTNGSGISIAQSANPTIDSCLFEQNISAEGAAVYLSSAASASIANCTFVSNSTGLVFNTKSGDGLETDISNCIIAASTSGPGIRVLSLDNSVTLSCCDVYANAGDDWVGYIAPQLGQRGNIGKVPLFCDPAGGDYALYSSSPCAPANSGCGLMGKYGVGCTSAELAVSPTSLNFGSSQTDMTFNISNAGAGTLTWSISGNQYWVTVNPTSGSTTGETDQVGVTVNRSGLAPGIYNDTLVVSSNGGNAYVTLSMQVANDPPQFVSGTENGVAVEWALFERLVTVTDNDGDPLSLSCPKRPEGASFTDYGDGTGLLSFYPGPDDVNNMYQVEVTATDGYTPVAATFNLTIENLPLEIGQTGMDSDVLINSYIVIPFNEPIIQETLAGNVTVASDKGSNLIWWYDDWYGAEEIPSLVVRVQNSYFQELDTIRVTVTGGPSGVLDMAGLPMAIDYTGSFTTGVVVYPGDADNNDVVDERDILPIGLYYRDTGPARDSVTTTWTMSPAHVTAGGISWQPARAAHADTDGDGEVNAVDICAVADNWQRSNLDAAAKGQSDGGNFAAAFKQLGGSVVAGIYQALIDCPESNGKAALEETLGRFLTHTEAALPEDFELYQNYPNPFNPATTIKYYLPENTHVTLTVYNVTGQRVNVLLDRNAEAGYAEVVWNGTDSRGHPVASGIYLYRLEAGNWNLTKRMMLLK